MSLGSRPAGLSSSLLSVKVSTFSEANRGLSAEDRLAREDAAEHTPNRAEKLSARRHDAKSYGKNFSYIPTSCGCLLG
jgi:hypothetical protein